MKHIRGIDFTSRPSRRKPITVAEAKLEGDVLHIERLGCLASFEEFDAALREPAPWVAGIDFPFGQPRRLIEAMSWSRDLWSDYVTHLEEMGKARFEQTIKAYTAKRPLGDKEHKRKADQLTGGISPMRLNFQPVGKMFFQGAPRIAASGASIVPCAPCESNRVIVEAYPAQAVKTLLGKKPGYKHDTKSKQTDEHTDARRRIVSSLSGERCRERYGLTVKLNRADRERLIGDATGDLLDAVLCALQAAWASGQPHYGVPEDCDPLEGWIVDPLR